MKTIIWNSEARKFVQSLSINTKREIGTLLLLLQSGQILKAPQSKPFKQIHKNAYELRVKDQQGAYRVIYVLCMRDKILIPHAFNKKTQKTTKKEINLAIKRLKELADEN